MQQEQALQRERARIAEDLHDDLGSSLARISLLSGLVTADSHHSGQVKIHAKKISQSADETVRALEEIVWAVRPGSDSRALSRRRAGATTSRRRSVEWDSLGAGSRAKWR